MIQSRVYPLFMSKPLFRFAKTVAFWDTSTSQNVVRVIYMDSEKNPVKSQELRINLTGRMSDYALRQWMKDVRNALQEMR